MENREEMANLFVAVMKNEIPDRYVKIVKLAYIKGYELQNKQLLDEIERLKSKINNQNKLLSDLYLATCDFDVSLFYPEKVEDFDLASNKVWIYINENNLQ